VKKNHIFCKVDPHIVAEEFSNKIFKKHPDQEGVETGAPVLNNRDTNGASDHPCYGELDG
jgi:hypothetical protein